MPKIPETDLTKLSGEICSGHYQAALPGSLPKHWILPIARDLRQVEATMADPSKPPTQALSGPMLLAVHLMAGRMAERQIDSPVMFSVSGFQRWISLYQFAVEREIVGRQTGIFIGGDEVMLLSALDSEIDGLNDEENDDDEVIKK
jgi:hypothetical protein